MLGVLEGFHKGPCPYCNGTGFARDTNGRVPSGVFYDRAVESVYGGRAQDYNTIDKLKCELNVDLLEKFSAVAGSTNSVGWPRDPEHYLRPHKKPHRPGGRLTLVKPSDY